MEAISEKYPMPEKKKTINWVEIEKADNGFKVGWSEREEKPEGCLDHCSSISRSLVFGSEEEDKAWDKFIEMKKIEFNCKHNKY